MILWILPVLTLGVLGLAEPTVEPPPEPAETTIIIQPAHVPHPALKYQLIPERYGRKAGNAALCYHRALLLQADQTSMAASVGQPATPSPAPTAEDQMVRWINQPLSELPRAEVRLFLDRYTAVFREIKLGADSAECDWGFGDRAEGIDLLLPEIQDMRSLARLLILQARLAVADGQLDQAWGSIQTGMVLARHVGTGPSLIQGLVGTSIGFQMSRCFELVMSAPGAPSYFWALADRPRPLLDLRLAFEAERHLIEQELPGLLELDHGVWSAAQCRQFIDQLQAKLSRMIDFVPGTDAALPRDLDPNLRRLGVAALCAKIEPEARRALVAAGRPAAEVEAMPVVQVAMLHVARQLQDHRDAGFKWANVPYISSAGRFEMPRLTAEAKRANPLLFSLMSFDSALAPARLAALRLDRQLDAIQVVEAIRLDATRHEGRLPASLDAITDLPIPLDIATGKPFEYRVTGRSAVLAAPSLAEVGFHDSYAIQIPLVPAQP